jgi:hypothetical protein
MKIIHLPKLIVVMLFCATTVSCSKEDTAPTYADLIIGKWYIREVVYDNGTSYIPQNSCEAKSAFDFTKSGEFSLITYAEIDDLCKPAIIEGPYILAEEEKKIMISDGTNSEVLDILKLDTKQMELYMPPVKGTYKLEKAL